MIANSKKAKIKMVAVVRDKEGNPKFDDIHNIQPEVMAVLTDKDKLYIKQITGE